MIQGYVYDAMSVAELLYHMRTITGILEQRWLFIAPQQQRLPVLASFSGAWNNIPPKVMTPPTPPLPASAPQPPAILPEVTQLKACSQKDCTCYYTIQKDDDPKSIKLDPCELFVFGIDAETHCMTEREKLADILTGSIRTTNIHVPSGEEYAFLKFKSHERATKAQQALVTHGYVVNFRKKNSV